MNKEIIETRTYMVLLLDATAYMLKEIFKRVSQQTYECLMLRFLGPSIIRIIYFLK